MEDMIDLELYTLSIVKINSSFSKLEQDEYDAEAIELLKESVEDLNRLYQQTLIDLSLREVNYGEYDYFLMNAHYSFQRYIDNILDYILILENDELKLILEELVKLLKSFIKVSQDYFEKRGLVT